MGKVTGFLEFARVEETYEGVEARKQHYREFIPRLTNEQAGVQGARCMDCGIPFCMSGCPVNNIIPDFNDLVFRQDWKSAIETLHSTNNFPEFTGRICPAPCEEACVLRINDDPVGIKSIEHAIIDKAWEEGWVRPQPAAHRTGKKVAVVGSGGAGLACAQQLARAGHEVTVFEKSDRIGGLLRYGIPDFKLEKGVIDRRLEQMREEGVKFRPGVFIGTQFPGKGIASDARTNLAAADVLSKFDAVVLAGGAEQPRDLPIPGRDLQAVVPLGQVVRQVQRPHHPSDAVDHPPLDGGSGGERPHRPILELEAGPHSRTVGDVQVDHRDRAARRDDRGRHEPPPGPLVDLAQRRLDVLGRVACDAHRRQHGTDRVLLSLDSTVPVVLVARRHPVGGGEPFEVPGHVRRVVRPCAWSPGRPSSSTSRRCRRSGRAAAARRRAPSFA